MQYDTTNWRLEKILTLEQIQKRAQELREQGKRLVTVNGSFDILHAGHLDQLEEAKRQGDVLFVGLNSDVSIQAEKGPARPFIPEQARAAMLAALVCVDYVVIIDVPYAEVPQKLLTLVQPTVHVNGPDYGKPEMWIEWPVMQQFSVQGYTAVRRNDLSTTKLVQKIKASS